MPLPALLSWSRLQLCRTHFEAPLQVHLALSAMKDAPLELRWKGPDAPALQLRSLARARGLLEFLLEQPAVLETARPEGRGLLGFEWKGSRVLLRPCRDEFAMFRQVWLDDVYRVNELPPPIGTVIDLGARTGLFASRVALLGAERVLAFEPLEEDRALLVRNTAEAGATQVQVQEELLGAHSGQRAAILYPEGDGRADAFADATTITLEDLFERHKVERCDLLKARIDQVSAVEALAQAPSELLRGRVRRVALALATNKEIQAALPPLRALLSKAGLRVEERELPDEGLRVLLGAREEKTRASGRVAKQSERLPRSSSARLAKPAS